MVRGPERLLHDTRNTAVWSTLIAQVSLVFVNEIQLNLSTTVTLETEECGHFEGVEYHMIPLLFLFCATNFAIHFSYVNDITVNLYPVPLCVYQLFVIYGTNVIVN